MFVAKGLTPGMLHSFYPLECRTAGQILPNMSDNPLSTTYCKRRIYNICTLIKSAIFCFLKAIQPAHLNHQILAMAIFLNI